MNWKRNGLFCIVTAAVVILTVMSAWASPVRIYTGGPLFEDITVVQNDDFSMQIGCGDTDPEDGYTWDLSLQNESTDKVLAVSFRNTALNSMMCETDAWDASGWTLKGGEGRKQTITWPTSAMQNILVKNVETVAFELKVYENNHFQEADGAIVDELFLVSTSDALPADSDQEEALPEEEETETEENLSEEAAEEETAAKTLSAELFSTGGTLYRDKRYSMQLMSAGEDEEGIPVWKVILENNTEDTVLFELQEAEVNGWAITPYWTQTVHPNMMAVSEISWWNIDTDISLLEEFRSASFVLRVWKTEKGWNPVYQQGERFVISIGGTDGEASGEDTEEMTEDPEEASGGKTDKGTVLYNGTSCIIRADEVLAEPAAGYGMVRLHIENTGEQTKTFSVERASYNGQRLTADWNQVIPGNSVKNSVFYLDLQGIEGDSYPETLVLHLLVSEGKTALFGDDVTIDLEKWYPETQAPAEDEETGDAYTDMDTLTILQHALKDSGFDPGTIDGKMGSDTRNAIRKYREQNGLPEGAAVDDELLFSLGIADADTYEKVQEALNKAGYDCGKPDGVPGDQTRRSIEAYREEHQVGSGSGVDEALLEALAVR